MPQTIQNNLATTLKDMGATPQVTGFVQGYIAGLGVIATSTPLPSVRVPEIEGVQVKKPSTGRRNRGVKLSKPRQAILSALTTNIEGMTSTAITKVIGSAIKANRMTPTLQTMEKAGLIYNKNRKWFAGTAAPAAATKQAQEPKRRRGRPAKVTKDAAAAKTGRGFNLAAAVLQAVSNGYATRAAIIAYLLQTYGETVRSNHVGIALQRHSRAGRLAQTGDNWMVTGAGQQTAQVS